MSNEYQFEQGYLQDDPSTTSEILDFIRSITEYAEEDYMRDFEKCTEMNAMYAIARYNGAIVASCIVNAVNRMASDNFDEVEGFDDALLENDLTISDLVLPSFIYVVDDHRGNRLQDKLVFILAGMSRENGYSHCLGYGASTSSVLSYGLRSPGLIDLGVTDFTGNTVYVVSLPDVSNIGQG